MGNLVIAALFPTQAGRFSSRPAWRPHVALRGETTITISAPAQLIWSMISDITRMGEWSPETTSAQWLEPATAPVAGARFKGTNKRRSSWTTVAEVLTAAPSEEFTFRVGKRRPAIWSYHLQADGNGTNVRESFDVQRYGPMDRLMFRLTTGVKDRQADLVAACQVTLARLKVAAELEAAGGSAKR